MKPSVVALTVVLASCGLSARSPAAWQPSPGHHVLGMADLLIAVTLAVGSAPGSLVRFKFEAPGSGAIVLFPWVLIPAFFVPLYLLTHVAIFANLAASEYAAQGESLPLSRRPAPLPAR